MEALLTASQIVCSQCEELVHRYAARCPYCQHDLTAPSLVPNSLLPNSLSLPENFIVSPSSFKNPAPVAEKSTSKITPLPQEAPHEMQALIKPASVQQAASDAELTSEVVNSSQENQAVVLFAQLALLGGAFFAFFGLMLKMFSKNGKLVLEWNAETWPYYLFPALVLLILGMAMLSRGDQDA